MPKSLEIFIKNTRQIASERCLNEGHLAKMANVNHSQLSNYFNGKNCPSLEILDRIAGALGIEPWELLRDPDAPPTPREESRAHEIVKDFLTRFEKAQKSSIKK